MKKFVITVEDFRVLMGVQEGQYLYFTMLRKRVLDKSVDEINRKTDIFVEYDLETEGRKFTSIIFNMQVKENSSLKFDSNQEIIEKLQALGLKMKQAEELLEKHDEQYLWANIAIVEEQFSKGKIKNVT